jgi:hypothetical protein
MDEEINQVIEMTSLFNNKGTLFEIFSEKKV